MHFQILIHIFLAACTILAPTALGSHIEYHKHSKIMCADHAHYVDSASGVTISTSLPTILSSSVVSWIDC